MGDNGRSKPLVIRKDGPRWRSIPMKVGRTESLTLTGVSPDKKGGTWVVGHGGNGAEVSAKAWNRDDGIRIDHFLLSPQAADLLRDCQIDKECRGREKPSDHVPIWIDLAA